jgi:hypothetical protein
MSFMTKLRTQMVAVLRYFNLNTNVGRDVFPTKHYRPGPASQSHPEFSLNFPVKSENLADIKYAERQSRIAAEAAERVEVLSSDPRTDYRNAFHFPSFKQMPFGVPERRVRYVQIQDPNKY